MTDNLSKRINVNKMESRITFKIKTRCYLELLTPQTTKLLGSTKSKTIKDENGENVPNLEIIGVVLIHCNIVNNDYQQGLRVLHTFIPNTSFDQLLYISPQKLFFKKRLVQNFHILKYGLLIKILNH